MKKKLFVMIAALLTVGSFAGYKLSQKDAAQDALTLANVEALAFDEIYDLCLRNCKYYYDHTCTIYTMYGFCVDCYSMAGNNYM